MMLWSDAFREEYAVAVEKLCFTHKQTHKFHKLQGDKNTEWLFVEPRGMSPLPAAFWKLHWSVHPAELSLMFDSIESMLLPQCIAFKFPCSLKGYISMNDSVTSASQLGKIVTIYPRTEYELTKIAGELRKLRGFGRGPKIASDLYLQASDFISARYGEFRNASCELDPCNRPIRKIPTPSGEIVPDIRSVDGSQCLGVSEAALGENMWRPIDLRLKTHQLLSLGNRSYVIERNWGSWFKCTLKCRGADGEEVLIKRVHHGSCCNRNGHTAEKRIEEEFASSDALFDAGYFNERRPELFTDELFSYLVLPWVKGVPLDQLERAALRPALLASLTTIEELHSLGFVHRDIKPTNIIYCSKSGRARLIDFELCSRIGTTGAPPGGTPGFRLDHLVNQDTPATTLPDNYAWAGTLLALILRIDPSEVPLTLSSAQALLRANGFGDLFKILRGYIEGKKDVAPLLRDSLRVLRARETLTRKSTRTCKRITDDYIYDRIFSACRATRVFRRSTPSGFTWCEVKGGKGLKDLSLNSGDAGVVYGLLKVKKLLGISEFDEDIAGGLEHLRSINWSLYPAGLFAGAGGAALCLTEGVSATGMHKYGDAAVNIFDSGTAHLRDPDLFFGSAGTLLAASMLFRTLESSRVLALASKHASYLIDSVREYNQMICWQPSGILDGSNVPKTSVSHGTIGIALALNLWGQAANDRRASEIGEEGLLSIYEHGRSQDGRSLYQYVSKQSSVSENFIWCRGVSGYLWALIRAKFDSSRKVRAEQAVRWARSIYGEQVIGGTPTLCHGLAGTLDLALDLLASHSDETIEDRVQKSLHALLVHGWIEFKGVSTWHAESSNRICPSFWVGMLGCCYALSRWAARESKNPLWQEKLFHLPPHEASLAETPNALACHAA